MEKSVCVCVGGGGGYAIDLDFREEIGSCFTEYNQSGTFHVNHQEFKEKVGA